MTPRARMRLRAPIVPLLVGLAALFSACSETVVTPRQPTGAAAPAGVYGGVPLLAEHAQAPVLQEAPAGLTPPALPGTPEAGDVASEVANVVAGAPGAATPASAGVAGAVRQLFLENLTTGGRALWTSTSGTITGTQALGNVPPQWQMRGAGDLNGDGKQDIVWQDTTTGGLAVWYLDGSGGVTSSAMLGVVPVAWKIVGAGDYNNDGKDDLLWWHQATGTLLFWYMDGSGGILSSYCPGSVPAPWKPTAARDLNGDGKDDILWQHTVAGTAVVWHMSGGAVSGSAAQPSVPPAWSEVGTIDLDGDGHQDIVWQNVSAGGLAVWYMDGAGNMTSRASLPALTSGYRVGALVRPSAPPSPATVAFSGIYVGDTSTPATLSAVSGPVNVVAIAELPVSSGVTAMSFTVDGRTACSQTISLSASGRLTISCSIATDLFSAGQPVYANGPHTLAVALLNGSGSAVATSSQTAIFSNTSRITLTATATRGPAISQQTGLTWYGGGLTVTATPQLFGGSPVAQVTITVAPRSSAASSKTVTAAPFTATWSASALLAAGGIADLQDSVLITVSGVTEDGQAFTGSTGTSRMALDNVAPVITQLNIPANGWVGSAFAFGSVANPVNVAFVENGVDNTTVRFYVGPTAATATVQVTTSADISEGTPVVLKAVATDALGNASTYYAIPGAAPTTNPNDVAVVPFQVDLILPVATFTSVVGNPSNNGGYTSQKTFTFSVADEGIFSSGLDANPLSVRQVLTTPQGSSCVAPSTPAPGTGACTFQQNTGLTLPSAATAGYDSVFAYASDRAGNHSATLTRTILIDNVLPTIGGMSFPAVSTGGSPVQLSAPATDNIAVANAYATATYTGGTGFILRYPTTTLAWFGQFNMSTTAASSIDFLIRSLQESNASLGGVSATYDPLTAYGLTIADMASNSAGFTAGGLTVTQVPQAAGGFDYSATISTFVQSLSAAVVCYASSGLGASCPAGVPSSTTLQTAAVGKGAISNPFSRVAFFRLSGTQWRLIGYTSTANVSSDGSGNYTWTYTLPYSPNPQTYTAGSSTVWTIMAIGVNASGDGLTSSRSTLTINEQ